MNAHLEPQNKRFVLITGASSGMGRATALLLARSGYHVFAAVRQPADVDDLIREAPDDLTPLLLDVTQPEQIEAALALIQKRVGRSGLYGLINNAGISLTAPTEFTNEIEARHLMDVHFFGHVTLIQRCLPLLRQFASTNRGSARILTVGSIGSLVASPYIPFYHAAKFAVLGFSESLRFELAPFGIDVIVLLPGSVKTEIFRKNEDSIQRTLAKLPPTGHILYANYLLRASRVAASIEKNGISAQRAAKVFQQALEVRCPAFRYFIGTDANIVNLVVRLLPDRARLWLTARQYNFKP